MNHLPIENERIGFSTRAVLFVSALLLLGNYYYLYFVGFEQGAVEGGWQFSLIKILGLSIAFFALLSFSLRKNIQIDYFFIFVFFVLSIVLYLAKFMLIGGNDTLFLNTVICGLPFVVFCLRRDLSRVMVFFEYCLVIIVVQIAIDTVVFLAGRSLWDNNAFIGGLGNPSSFGFVCNMLVCYVLFKRRRKPTSPFYFFILCYGVFMTSSMLAFLMLFMTVALWALSQLSFKRLVLVTVFGGVNIGFGNMVVSEHLEYKLKSAIGILDGGEGEQSASVSLRLAIHKEYIDNFFEEPIQAIFFGFNKHAYMKYDSQFLTYFSSFGFLISSLFFMVIFVVLIRSMILREHRFAFVLMLLFFFAFMTNRILDYYPVPFFMFLIMAYFYGCLSRKRISIKNVSVSDFAESPLSDKC